MNEINEEVNVQSQSQSQSQSMILWTWLITFAIFISMVLFVVMSTTISWPGILSLEMFRANETTPLIISEVHDHQSQGEVTLGSHYGIGVSPPPLSVDDFYGHITSGVHPLPTIIEEEAKLEQGLAAARYAIRKASLVDHIKTSNRSVYHNPSAFYQSYAEMEKRLKVYVYEEGEFPLVHNGPCIDIYSSEGIFIHEIEYGGAHKFRTKNPHSAHLFFLPFSVTYMVKYLYDPKSHDAFFHQRIVSDYVRVISSKHPFWNRSSGADHFMVSCHDWGPVASRGNPLLYNTSIRVLCNANSSEGFKPEKDASLPEIKLIDNYISPKLKSPPPANTSRPYLAFFAGGRHGPIRPILLDYWMGRDPDIPVHEYLPKGEDYFSFVLSSKFCLCPSGYEVASPRIIEAIYAECVPVIISKYYVFPFSDVLNWDAFSIKVEVSEIPRLKEILLAVPEDKYLRLKEGLRSVKKHFVFNTPSQKFDMFHMILHSVWLRRLNFRIGWIP
ncbi:glycosyltransferase [Lithospermum erythrorhizon]|uniref:Glycosyltransferase n=1 Tax=Lithospermum erythrorhizon TaxID=34254 RepID=A0AAV3PGX0_LITER